MWKGIGDKTFSIADFGIKTGSKKLKNYKRQEELCPDEMVPARPEKVLVEVSDQEEEWAEVSAREPVDIASAPNAAAKAPMPGECPAIP
jgi:hypothetical protein